MWSEVLSSWFLVVARPWRVSVEAVLTRLGWRRGPTRIVLSPMSSEWLREIESRPTTEW